MLTIFLSPKGGSGTTVTAAAWALAAAEHHGKAMFIDMCGDARAVLGMPETDAPGINDWLGESQTARGEHLIALGETTGAGLLVVHRGARFVQGAPRWDALVEAAASWDFPVVIDAGTNFVPDELRAAAGQTWMVVRPCYLALRRATRLARPDAVIVLVEPGRALDVRDVEAVLSVRSVATVPVDPSIARAVDAGVLAERHRDVIAAHLPPVE